MANLVYSVCPHEMLRQCRTDRPKSIVPSFRICFEFLFLRFNEKYLIHAKIVAKIWGFLQIFTSEENSHTSINEHDCVEEACKDSRATTLKYLPIKRSTFALSWSFMNRLTVSSLGESSPEIGLETWLDGRSIHEGLEGIHAGARRPGLAFPPWTGENE